MDKSWGPEIIPRKFFLLLFLKLSVRLFGLIIFLYFNFLWWKSYEKEVLRLEFLKENCFEFLAKWFLKKFFCHFFFWENIKKISMNKFFFRNIQNSWTSDRIWTSPAFPQIIEISDGKIKSSQHDFSKTILNIWNLTKNPLSNELFFLENSNNIIFKWIFLSYLFSQILFFSIIFDLQNLHLSSMCSDFLF